MFSGLTWHEFIGGIAVIVLLVIIGALLALADSVPSELYGTLGTLIGLLFGIQIPKTP